MLKKINIMIIWGMGMLCLFLLGCQEESFLLTEEMHHEEAGDENLIALEETVGVTEEEYNTQKQKDAIEENNSKSVQEDIILAKEQEDQTVRIAVHICGAVKQPGVYFFEEGTRIVDAVNQAGGFSQEADEDYVNLALMLQDGMKIEIPTKEEVKNGLAQGNDPMAASGNLPEETPTETNGKVDLNMADEALLCTLPGIGESRAKSIIAYRNQHGPFEKIEDVMKVSGIKEAAFEKMKDEITVSR